MRSAREGELTARAQSRIFVESKKSERSRVEDTGLETASTMFNMFLINPAWHKFRISR